MNPAQRLVGGIWRVTFELERVCGDRVYDATYVGRSAAFGCTTGERALLHTVPASLKPVQSVG